MISRREFLLKTAAVASASMSAGGILLPQIALADDDKFWQRDRVLSLYRKDAKETRHIKFFENGRYIQEGYSGICWMLRDVVDGNRMVGMNINLINLLFAQQQYLRDVGRPNPMITLLSGYRTKRHNDNLEGAAKNSQHLFGNAADYRIAGADLRELTSLARRFQVGGIGMYRTYVHNDIGRYREWNRS